MPVIFRLLTPLVAGILLAYFLDIQLSLMVVVTLTLALVLSYFLLRKKITDWNVIPGILITLLFFSLGIWLESTSDSRSSETYFTHHIPADSTAFFQLRLADYPEHSGSWVKFTGTVIAANDKPTSGKVQLYIERDSLSEKLQYGDLLYAGCRFFEVHPPANPHEFDYRAYLNHKDVHHQAFIRSGHWKKSGNDANPVLQLVYDTRAACSSVIDESGMQPENKAVAKALLLGDKEMISDELMLSYAASGTLHVLAVSGLHVGIVMLILGFVLTPLKRLQRGKILFVVVALAGIWFYTLLTGFSPSILRAAVMFSFVLIGNELQRDTAIYQSLLVSAIILILFDPHIIFNIGFLLSYLAVFGIVFFHPKIYALFYSRNKLIDKIWQLVSVSTAAQIATLPLSLYCFHQFPAYFLLANLIVIPVSFMILILGIAALVLHTIPYISEFLFYLLNLLINVMNEGVRLVEKLPYAVLENLVIRWYDALLLFAFIFSLTFMLTKRSKKLLHLTFAFSVILLVSLLYQKSARTATSQVVFYQVKNAVIVDVMRGQQIFCLATHGSIADEQKMRFHIYPNRLNACGTLTAETGMLHDSSGIFSVDSKTVLFLNQNKAEYFYTTQFPETDLIYLYEIAFLNQKIIDLISEKNIPVVIGPEVSYSLKRYLRKQMEGTLIHDLNQQGALVLNLDRFGAE